MTRRLLYLAPCFFLFLSSSASVARAQKTYAVGIGGGPAVPVGRFNDVERSGFNGAIWLAVGVADLPVGIRFDGIYDHFSQRDPVAGQTGTAVPYDARMFGALANIIYTLPGTNVKPYVVAGAGYYNTRSLLTGAKADNNLGFNGGLGLSIGVGHFATFLETRYHSISRSVQRGGVIQFVPVTVGLLF